MRIPVLLVVLCALAVLARATWAAETPPRNVHLFVYPTTINGRWAGVTAAGSVGCTVPLVYDRPRIPKEEWSEEACALGGRGPSLEMAPWWGVSRGPHRRTFTSSASGDTGRTDISVWVDHPERPTQLRLLGAVLEGVPLHLGGRGSPPVELMPAPSWVEPAGPGATATAGDVLLRWSAPELDGGPFLGGVIEVGVSVREGFPWLPETSRFCRLRDDGASVLPWALLQTVGARPGSIVDLQLARAQSFSWAADAGGEMGRVEVTWQSIAETQFVIRAGVQ